MSDIKDDSKEKGYMTQDDLIAEMKKHDPNFKPETANVINMRPTPDISHIVPLSFRDMQKETPKPIEFVLAPCLPTQGIAWVYAASGVGKTLFTLNIAYAIAQGGEFLKYFCPKPRRVLYVDGEMQYNQLHSRTMQIAAQHGELDFDNLFFITPDKLLPFRVPMIDTEAGQQVFVELMKKYDFDVLILDNLSMLASIDENKSHEFKPIQDWLLYLRSLGKTIIIVHHAGKEKAGYRGTSRMLDCADVAISLQPVADNDLEEVSVRGRKFKIVYQKARIFGGKDALPFEVTLEDNKWHFQSIEQTDTQRIIEMLGMKMCQRDIAKDLGLSLSKVNRLIKKARRDGLIRD